MTNDLTNKPLTFFISYGIYRFSLSTIDYIIDEVEDVVLNQEVTAYCDLTGEKFCLERTASGWFIPETKTEVKISV